MESPTPELGGFFIFEIRTRFLAGRTLARFLAEISSLSSVDSEEGTSEVAIKTLEKISFDGESIGGSLALLSPSTENGYLNIENTLDIKGQFLSKGQALAISIRSPVDQPLERSLIRRIDGMVLALPQADDTLVDLGLRLELYSFNADALLEYVLSSSLASAHQKLAHFLWPRLPHIDGGSDAAL